MSRFSNISKNEKGYAAAIKGTERWKLESEKRQVEGQSHESLHKRI